ncbi:hypothetical protein LIX60_07825 [Streptomyces sp. S07_1.15]|uniref:hypothetical protein n=1 Tax=Streptomyces sp. S07_1.15 TaxID=2873925 RepID=UPI001D145DD4|nr:hypothetical protein [Streptomyces sp. S07_1.15]MCC3651378.1 hypothetical protein [Streptomyces sp. S07_1.15]
MITQGRFLFLSTTSSQQKLVTVSTYTALAATLIACSGGGEERKNTGRPATQVCDSAFDEDASKALQKISGESRFEELGDSSASSRTSRFSLEEAARKLETNKGWSEYECKVYKAGDETGKELLDLSFASAASLPDPKESKREGSLSGQEFNTGAWAGTTPEGAKLYFRCSVNISGTEIKYVHASIFVNSSQITAKGVDREKMSIINSASRRFAEKVDCQKEARLATGVPRSDRQPS